MSVSYKKIDKQVEYINKNLKDISSCTLDKSSKNIDNISSKFVKDILDNKFYNGHDMNAVLCMFDNLFLSTAKSKKHGIFHLSVHVTKWIKKLEKIDIDSSSGFVYFSDILSNVKVIIKLPQEVETDYDEMIREYFIGIKSINKLRYIIPNFVYTFGAFICPMKEGILCKDTYKEDSNKIPFVVYENIPGDNMQKMLSNNKLTFSQYLGLFIQVLLALEVAQRTISFCHFDFHTGNLMCRDIKDECKYNVPLDNMIYEVRAKEYLPVIIDFGLSSVKHKGNIIGSYTFPEYGMMHYMLPGVDMYKFLYYSCVFAQGDVKLQILNLLSFYGKDDPYKFLINGSKSFNKANKEYAKKGSYSRVTSYTPLEFLNWILSKPEYDHITSLYMNKKERYIYVPLSYSTSIQTYDDIFNESKLGREKAIEMVNKSFISNSSKSSYIISKYFLQVLNGYNKKLNSKELVIIVKNINDVISRSRSVMISSDYKMLWKYQNIELPNMIDIQDDSKSILNITIISKKLLTQNKEVIKLIERYLKNITFFTEILPYLQFMYTIREIGSEKIYSKFLKTFLTSVHYKTYDKYCISINRTYRWCNTLINSLE
jgi:hypothetical protein